jgi:sugar phosphate isomerase/epimerase
MTEISYQLYSSREFPPLAETLQMLKRLGYDQVEGYGGIYGDLGLLCEELAQAELTMTSGHFGLDMLEGDIGNVLEIASATGMTAVYCPHIAAESRPTNASGWRGFGERLQQVGEPLRKAGLIFGWHNHDFEFARQADGSIPLEEIFIGGPDLSWEADIAWIARGGGDPIDWISRLSNRIKSVHIKDIAKTGECLDEDGWADVGHGTMDWAGIWAALENTGAELFVMEHDKPNDHERFARRSIASLHAY